MITLAPNQYATLSIHGEVYRMQDPNHLLDTVLAHNPCTFYYNEQLVLSPPATGIKHQGDFISITVNTYFANAIVHNVRLHKVKCHTVLFSNSESIIVGKNGNILAIGEKTRHLYIEKQIKAVVPIGVYTYWENNANPLTSAEYKLFRDIDVNFLKLSDVEVIDTDLLPLSIDKIHILLTSKLLKTLVLTGSRKLNYCEVLVDSDLNNVKIQATDLLVGEFNIIAFNGVDHIHLAINANKVRFKSNVKYQILYLENKDKHNILSLWDNPVGNILSNNPLAISAEKISNIRNIDSLSGSVTLEKSNIRYKLLN